MKATGVTAGLAESNGSYMYTPPGGWLKVTCGLTACTPGSALDPTLGNEYGRTLPLPFTSGRSHRTASTHCGYPQGIARLSWPAGGWLHIEVIRVRFVVGTCGHGVPISFWPTTKIAVPLYRRRMVMAFRFYKIHFRRVFATGPAGGAYDAPQTL